MKKILALVLALTMALGMSTMAMAATKKIDGLPDYDVLEFVNSESDSFRAGDTIHLRFKRDNAGVTDLVFNDATDSNLATAVEVDDITKKLLRDSKITVKKIATKGGELIDTVEFAKVTNDSGKEEIMVEIKLVEDFVAVKEKDFDFTVNLYFEGKKVQSYSFAGTMGFELLDLHDGDDYVNLSEGEVAKAHDYLRGVEVELGEGVTMKVNMFSGTKYYGTASQKFSSADATVMNRYPEIETIYNLNTVNLKTGGNIVTIDLDDNYYVYNAEGNYIGTTAETLPYSNKYYLATSRITMTGSESEVEVPVEDDEATAELEAPEMGGDGESVSGVNDNPSTGSNGFVSAAVVAGVIALAAAGMVASKQ